EMLNDALQELLLSIGQQIGLTIESLQNMQSLRQSSKLLQSVFDGISDPLILLTPDGTLQMVNQAFLLRNSLRMDDALGTSIDALSSKQKCIFSGRLRELDLHAKTQHTKEIQLDDGSIFDISFYPILSSDESVQAIVCLAKDVTTLKETEQRIQQTEKLVAVGQLAAGVAHEINNPLGVILCHTDIMKENNEENEETLNDIRTIERHAENCKRIVADLLDFSRSRESRIERQVQSVNAVIEVVLSMVGQQFKKNQITLLCNLDDSIPQCLLDSRRIQQVLVNLIMNGIHAIGSKGKGKISVGTRAEEGHVLIEIEDDGPGISKEILDKIFDPFFSTKEPGQGTGLGLSVSYGIVHEHGGEIRVQSSPGHGARFTVILPAVEENMTNE
ncbi:MAG: ATP-binding protein, partial [Thermodesulfobacteriota bacterium]